MANATDKQVQNFVDGRIRPFCEHLRALLTEGTDIKASIDDIYAALNVGNPTWTDTRTDGPPHLLTPSDVLAVNAFITNLLNLINNDAQLPIVRKGCVRSVTG